MGAGPVLVFLKQYRNVIVILTTIAALSPLLALSDSKECRTGFVALLMAVLWMTEALPLPVTSLIPVALFPFLGIMTSGQTCAAYLKETSMMSFGELSLAIAIEKTNLHIRVALNVLKICGANPQWLMLGFMSITVFLSMWINNTAATAMMIPLVDAVIKEIFQQDAIQKQSTNDLKTEDTGSTLPLVVVSSPKMEDEKQAKSVKFTQEDLHQMRMVMNVSVAYSASIGGVGTLIGSNPPLVLRGITEELYPSITGFSFAAWMALNVPCVIVSTLASWMWLTFLGSKSFRRSASLTSGKVSEMISRKCAELGAITFQEIVVMVLFLLVISAWFFKDPDFIPGWADLVPYRVGDSSVVILVVLSLFLIPANPGLNPDEGSSAKQGILTWSLVQKKFPWGLLLLLGGGFAISDASKISGLSHWLGTQLSNSGIHLLPNFVLLLVICCISATITEVASNTATANVVLPVIAHLSDTIKLNPLYLMIPAAVGCSFAFLLPAGSPPNAIVYAASNMKTMDMVKTGIVVKFVCILVICVAVETLGGVVLHLHDFPSWANVNPNVTLLKR